jgi:methylthioribose-1-phosphate isomerase
MQVRGAPLIGATAAYGLAIGLQQVACDATQDNAVTVLSATRPTAVNLHWALARMTQVLRPLPPAARCAAAWMEAAAIAEEDVAQNAAIGQHGLQLLRELPISDGALNIMTHCNAGWLATVDWGTALSPVYAAHDAGLPVHVWVSETRPRNQGLLTAWELAQHGVAHSLLADNAAGLLMRQGRVAAVIVGADRIAANGDVANKVGTYLKALACADNGIPFYVAAPRSTLDFACPDGDAIPIEERDGDEFRRVHGLDPRGVPSALQQLPAAQAVSNPAFDVTPARLVTAIITERGTCPASRQGLLSLYPEEARHD